MLLPILCFGPVLLAPVSYLVGRKAKTIRDCFIPAVCGLTLIGCLMLWNAESTFTLDDFCGLGLHLKADGFRSLYATVAAFMWLMTSLLSKDYFSHSHHRSRYYFFYLMTLGATIGVFLSDDLYTTFIFFEIMSLTSYPWVAHEENSAAMRAAGTYLTVAVLGGLTTLMGLFLLWHELGTLSFDGIRIAMAERTQGGMITAASWLVIFGFAAKAGLYPLHIWLPKAHPVAPAPASALLSGILTKSGIFGIVVVCSRLMAGNAAFGNLLLAFACITMFLGALLALFSVDLKRTLACSSMSQIGFITVGLAMMVLLGEKGGLPAYGAVLHMVNHSLIKLCLFMAAGVVYMNLHKLDLNDIRGFGRGKPVLHIVFLLGALAIACIPPLGSGYNSKSLLHEGILEVVEEVKIHGGSWQIYKAVEILFLISGGLTIAYMAKLYVCIFWEKNSDPERQQAFDERHSYISVRSAIALLGSAAILPLLGALPGLLMQPIGERSAAFFGQHIIEESIHFFSPENLIGAAESIAIGAVVYFVVVRRLLMRDNRYINAWPEKLDLENTIYRPVIFGMRRGTEDRFAEKGITAFVAGITRIICELPEHVILLIKHTVLRKSVHRVLPPVGTRFTWAAGSMLNRMSPLLNMSIFRKHPVRGDFRYILANLRDESAYRREIATRTVSFGLLLVGIGIVFICVVLLAKL